MPDRIDHVILFTPELEQGRDHVEALLGMRPVIGGRHPDLGTHNALLGLGPDCYFEVMAPDPEAERPLDLAMLGMGDLVAPRIGTWILRAENIEAARDRAEGVGLGDILSGHRDNPDGSRLTWRLTNPFVFPFDGVVPFLIAWGDTPHPGTQLPTVGSLTELRVSHPDPEGVRAAFQSLGVGAPVDEGPVGVTITIETASGPVTFS